MLITAVPTRAGSDVEARKLLQSGGAAAAAAAASGKAPVRLHTHASLARDVGNISMPHAFTVHARCISKSRRFLKHND